MEPLIDSSSTKLPPTRYLELRRLVYDHLHAVEIETKSEHFVRVLVASLIGLSMVSVVLETVPALEKEYSAIFYFFEVVTVVAFSIEYLLRLWTAIEIPKYDHHAILGRLHYIVSPLGLVDLLAILPFYLPGLISIDLRFIRGLRLIRLMRVMKLGHYSKSLSLIATVARKKRHEMGAALLIVIILLVFASSIMYYMEHDSQPQAFSSIPASLWWGIATLTTVGYGDIVPITMLGRVFASVISVLGIGVFALPSGIFVAGFVEEMQLNRAHVLCPRCQEEIKARKKSTTA